MHKAIRLKGFTLIELLTVIAIIAVLAAILFPLAGSVREQARATDCQTKLHQLYVAAAVYRDDEGGFPPALFGYAEVLTTDQACNHGATDPTTGGPLQVAIPYGGSGTPTPIDQVVNGFLYREQVRDASSFRCPDNNPVSRIDVTVAHYPTTQSTDPNAPYYWPAYNNNSVSWIGDFLQSKGCPTDGAGVVDCFWDVDPQDACLGRFHLQPRYYYRMDSYDIGPRIGTDGTAVRDQTGSIVFDRHYSADWTGVRGQLDLPNQLKYQNPPPDTTILTYCTWHAATAGAGNVQAINIAGTAKKLDLAKMLKLGPRVFEP